MERRTQVARVGLALILVSGGVVLGQPADCQYTISPESPFSSVVAEECDRDSHSCTGDADGYDQWGQPYWFSQVYCSGHSESVFRTMNCDPDRPTCGFAESYGSDEDTDDSEVPLMPTTRTSSDRKQLVGVHSRSLTGHYHVMNAMVCTEDGWEYSAECREEHERAYVWEWSTTDEECP